MGWGGQPRTLPSSGGTAFSFKFDFSSNLITIIGGQRRGDFCNSCGSKAKQMWFSVLLKWFSTLGFKRALKTLICTGERTGSMEGEKCPPLPGAPQTGEQDFQASAPLGLSPSGAKACSLALKKLDVSLAVSSSIK